MSTFRDNWKAWAKDLRTTKEPQATGFLHRVREDNGKTVGFCCLGRVCILAKTPISTPWEIGRSIITFGVDHYTGVLPRHARAWLGIRFANPQLAVPSRFRGREAKRSSGMPSLSVVAGAADLNDSYQLNFKEIAACVDYTIRYGHKFESVSIPDDWDAEYDG